MEKSEEFDKWILNLQNFLYQILHLKIFGRLFIVIFKYSSGVCHVMSGHGILKYFCPIWISRFHLKTSSYTQSVWTIIEDSLTKVIASTNCH